MEIYVRVLVRSNIARRQERNINYAPELVHIFPYPTNNLFITYALHWGSVIQILKLIKMKRKAFRTAHFSINRHVDYGQYGIKTITSVIQNMKRYTCNTLSINLESVIKKRTLLAM